MSISILLIRALVEAVEHAGTPREAFFETARFDARRIDQGEGRTTLEELDSLHEHALDLTGDEALGLHMGEMATATTYNLAAHLVAHATTLRDGIAALLRFHRLLMDKQVWHLVEHEGAATLLCDVASGSARCKRLRAELTMTGFFRMVRFFGRDAKPRSIAFEHAAPAYRGEYTRIFEGLERFDQSFTGIVVDRELLGAAQLHADPEFHAALEAQAERRLWRLTRSATYAERVREYLVEQATAGGRDMEAAARALGLSVRSLRRRLREEGVSYGDLAEEALETLAKRLLSDEKRSIEETAYTMGFSDPSAFYRAFKRWTGTTPKEYRSRRQTAVLD